MRTKDFIKLEDEIKQILIDDPRTRNDDMYLYLTYFEKKVKDVGVANNVDAFYTCFHESMIRKSYKIATFAAVTRCRRKIQEKCPELASERAKKARAKKEEEFKDYARL